MYEEEISRSLKEDFGLSYLRPHQMLIIQSILESIDSGRKRGVIGCLPTGAGKSLCFMLPARLRKSRMIAVFPLLSLMNDQARRFREAGIKCAVARGGMSREERIRVLSSYRDGRIQAILTNPEMLSFFLSGPELFFLDKTDLFVLDEAHTAVSWGNSFRPSFKALSSVQPMLSPTVTLAFSATIDKETSEGIKKLLFPGIEPYIVHQSIFRENQFFVSIHSLCKDRDLVRLLESADRRPAVVFCRSRLEAERTSTMLSGFFRSSYYHAMLPKDEKERKEREFFSSEDGVMCATIAYGMGVDKKGIRTVVHTSLPQSASDYLQESGRGGRDGDVFLSIVLYYSDEASPIKRAFVSGCIRSSLLNAMGEKDVEARCLNCSGCVPYAFERSGEKEIMDFMRKHRIVTEKGIVMRLRKRKAASGRLSEWSKKEIKRAIRELEAERRLRMIEFFGNCFILLEDTKKAKAEKGR